MNWSFIFTFFLIKNKWIDWLIIPLFVCQPFRAPGRRRWCGSSTPSHCKGSAHFITTNTKQFIFLPFSSLIHLPSSSNLWNSTVLFFLSSRVKMIRTSVPHVQVWRYVIRADINSKKSSKSIHNGNNAFQSVLIEFGSTRKRKRPPHGDPFALFAVLVWPHVAVFSLLHLVKHNP